MPDAADLAKLGNAAIVAPAGHGKTEIIANVAAMGRRALILTHTHAGVHAIRSRLKRLRVHHSTVAVDTIAGWSMRYAHAFPHIARPPPDLPKNNEEWEQLYRGAANTLAIGAVRDVVEASYDRILVDEYQDCNPLQHELATALSGIVPTLIFGDPMQGIFEFAGANLSWTEVIHRQFPLAGTLETPHRWRDKNPELGEWIADTRGKLMRGEPIDLAAGPIAYRESDNAFDMGAFFDGIDAKEGSFAAIHCNKGLCYKLASAAGGGYQAIEEVAAKRLREFASAWDGSVDGRARQRAIVSLLDECFRKHKPTPDEAPDPADAAVADQMNAVAPALATGDGIDAARELLALARKRPSWKPFRSELLRDAERAITEVGAGRVENISDGVGRVRQRLSVAGRNLPKRTVSTPLLLKGLEFDHVVVPDATHFARESQAQAKLFYVAISRATRSLTLASSERVLRFSVPQL